MSKYKAVILLLLFSTLCISARAKEFNLFSPDKRMEVTISTENEIKYSISFNGASYILPSAISIMLDDGRIIGKNPSVKKIENKYVNNTVDPLYGINNKIEEQYNELKIIFEDNYAVIFRVYNEGFAWRFETSIVGEIAIVNEQCDFNFADNYPVFFHPGLSESFYRLQKISDAGLKPNYSSLPILIKPENGPNILIHESDVLDYPCLSVKSKEERANSLSGIHPFYPKEVEPGGYNKFNLIVKDTEDYIAKTTGKRMFPWRLIAFETEDKDILNNELVYLLASENKLPDTDWINPGKVAWDWWNAMNLTGVPFKTGFNTDTYKYFIDFAAENGIEFINIDDGWSDSFDLTNVTDKLDMEEVTAYAKSKNVGIFLWCVWWTIDNQMTEALDMFQKWGIKGIKVDFMDRDDQIVVNFHERLLSEAAKRKIMVNYHGSYHPTGLSRTYPNNINTEGVRGLEWNKFNPEGVTPDHDLLIPFIRMFAGSMDYTPGAMQNYKKDEWRQITDRPMSQGTRCHQLAMFVVYHAPLQMLADSPTAYEKEPEYLKFLSLIPTSWDVTYPLDSQVGEYVNIARKKNEDWFVGGMTNWSEREVSLNLDFLDEGKDYIAEIFYDGENAERVGNDYSISHKKVKKNEQLTINMASGGGYAIRLSPEGEPAEYQENPNIIMFGNSIIAGADWNELLERTDVRNSGRSGFTTSHYVMIMEDQVIKYRPDLCFIEGGINDIGVGIPLERVKLNFQKIVDRLLDEDITPILSSVIYVNYKEEKLNRENEVMIDKINDFLQELAASKQIMYFDTNSFLSKNKRLKREFTTDGVHLTSSAYQIWAEEIKKILKSKKM